MPIEVVGYHAMSPNNLTSIPAKVLYINRYEMDDSTTLSLIFYSSVAGDGVKYKGGAVP